MSASPQELKHIYEMWCVVNGVPECHFVLDTLGSSFGSHWAHEISFNSFPFAWTFFSVSARAAHLTRQVGWRRVRENALNRNSYPGAIEIGRATSPAPSGLRSKQVDTSMHRERNYKTTCCKTFSVFVRRLNSHKKSSMLLMFLKFRSHYI